MNGAPKNFCIGEQVRALRRDDRDEHTYHAEIGTITRYLCDSPGWPYGLVVQFADGTEEAFYYLFINIPEPRKSFVANLTSQFIEQGVYRI